MFGQVEQVLLKLIRKDSVGDEVETLQANFKGDCDLNFLTAELELLPVICGKSQPINLGDVIRVIQSLPNEKHELIRNVIISIVLTNGETSATVERLSTLSRSLKTWLHSAMTQKRFSILSLIHKNQTIVDKMLLIDVLAWEMH